MKKRKTSGKPKLRVRKDRDEKRKVKFNYRNAKGVEGILLRSYDDGPAIFRIYGKGDTFKDYEVLHDDVSVKILDDSAELLESSDGEHCYLDYSRSILGQDAKYDRTEE